MAMSKIIRALEQARHGRTEPRMTVFSLRIEAETIERLKAYLERNGPWPHGTRSRLIRTFIANGVQELEQHERRAKG